MFQFVSPIDQKPLIQKDYRTLTCQDSGTNYAKVDGVWHLIAPERMELFNTFIHEYETVRQAEGRSDSAETYAQLPYAQPNHPLAEMWRQRTISFEAFLEIVLIPKEKTKKQLSIIDLGAGNGWMSNRLAERGHCVAAVDLTINGFDGLGVHQHYGQDIVSIQAEFDHLPLASDQFDLAVFNASLHYSADYGTTLNEALRLLNRAGTLAVIDTPVYQKEQSGMQMVAEREKAFEAKHRFKSNSLGSKNFLTQTQISDLQKELNRPIQIDHPVSAVRRGVRRLKTAVRGQREAAEFPILTIEKRGRGA